MSEHNSRDCAALVSLTVEKQLAAKYRDVQCLLPVEEIQVLEVVRLEVFPFHSIEGPTFLPHKESQ